MLSRDERNHKKPITYEDTKDTRIDLRSSKLIVHQRRFLGFRG